MELSFRKAKESDCDILFKWANDKIVRENSFKADEINYNEHISWFHSKLNSNNCYMFILCIINVPVGQVRIDVENEKAIISYSIDKNYRGQGLSIKMLNMLEQLVKKDAIKINEFIGYVKINNISSQKVFQKLNYNKLNYDNYIKYYKLI